MQQDQILTLRDNAKNQLLEIKNIETGATYLNKLKAIEVWAKAEKKDAELQNIVAEQKLRTQRILGQLIKEGQDKGEIAVQKDFLKQNSPVIEESNNGKKKLSDMGLSAYESFTFQSIASIPEEVFENEIEKRKQNVEEAVKELTTAGMMRLAKTTLHDYEDYNKPFPVKLGELKPFFQREVVVEKEKSMHSLIKKILYAYKPEERELFLQSLQHAS